VCLFQFISYLTHDTIILTNFNLNNVIGGGVIEIDNVIAAFSAEQVVRLTGLTTRQLFYWDQTGFFRPKYASENRKLPYSRIYSFCDLVGLRTLSVLTNGHNVTMPQLKRVAERLSKYSTRPWAEIKLGVWKRKVQWIEPETGLPAGVDDKQYLMIEMFDIINEMKAEVDKARTRDQSEIGNIVHHRYVVHNQKVVAGTRIPTRAIINFHDAGYTPEQIINEYPTLTYADIIAVISTKSKNAA
jgi:uncharacterized protein (DUF433 family)